MRPAPPYGQPALILKFPIPVGESPGNVNTQAAMLFSQLLRPTSSGVKAASVVVS
jgi:hypothetical protein